ncbi:hypothetical protein R3P38DRAFT_3497872 [Favolaschia claudopus]|uniref:Uncharacterized protein n=1 Tax=Favolaschia claudopus TaxID=2862362 RepID=A0AAV9Z468_9AGAR
MALFSFLGSNFFDVQTADTSTHLSLTTATRPSSSLPSDVLAASSSASNSSPNALADPFSPTCKPALSPSQFNARYIPKSFVYNTPINPTTFGAVYDSGYSSLSSRSVNYHSPSIPMTSPSNSPSEPTPCEKYLQLYQSGRLQARRSDSSHWELKCTICKKWIKTSVPSRRPLSIPNHFSVLEGHTRSRTCTAYPARASTAPPIPSPRKASPSMVNEVSSDEEDEDPFQFQLTSHLTIQRYGRSSSLPLEASSVQSALGSMVIVQTCPGSPVDWPVQVGSFTETFPFHPIGVQPGSLSFDVEIHNRGRNIVAFSKQCSGEAQLNGCCPQCTKIPAEVQKLVDLALQADSRINHRYLSWSQIRNLLADRTEEMCKWRLKIFPKFQVHACRRCQTDYIFSKSRPQISRLRSVMEAIANNNLPRLQQLINVGIRRGSSPNALIRMIQSALEGVYQPRPVLDSRTLDIALLVFRLGGRKLLYAVNHGLGLPSLRTLRNHMAFTKVMPTVGMISVEDIVHNIREVVLKPRAAAATPAAPPWQGDDGRLRLMFWRIGTYPILALPTCKSVGPSESSTIYETVTEAWIEHAAVKVGMPWSWSTDGEALRRKAGYKQFVRHKLPRTSPIFGTLASMAGLNIFTGLHSVTLDLTTSMFSSVRICTLIRSAAGMALCNGRIINPAVLTRFLARLPDQSEDPVRTLLFPDDPQDVPRAVELMEAIIEFLAYDFGEVNADTAADLDSIRLLALILKSILAPFITPDMSLTDQMTHLATYAHLTFTLSPEPAYLHVKSAIWRLAINDQERVFLLEKQQKLDPTKPFYLFQVGDDPLETVVWQTPHAR